MAQVGELVAGRELDALVAEKVMGWHSSEDGYFWLRVDGGFGGYVTEEPPFSGGRAPRFAPSTDITAAWQIVEHMHKRGFHIVLWFDDFGTGQWGARFPRGLIGRDRSDHGHTAPLAICRAALAAIG
jgi:hypothetical protein